ncbi:PEP-CTERM sorting domain-containing protein [Massilia forsythiae]|uniref:PEP-CTERM sorting domain-containing protein n=1 Tax=Massilia forsythiae TaxID=2728020 RepID=A0A7Z2VX41_9BURK|nr:PEP-CTERM sorting domain-containing protein [Massilia forsythiae]QJE00814.1 PEP-CTERM sorting domain-containing protein [Massilia forsythiae]
MKTITILETLVAATLVAGQAHAAPLALDGATIITATYNGKADNVLGLDHNFAAEAGSNVSHLDPSGSGVEFLSGDYLFGFDFSDTGLLTVYNNMAIPAGADYRFTFDFGATLAAPIGSFTLVDGSAVNGTSAGVPGLSVLDGHRIGVDLSRVTWNADFGAFTAQIGAAAATDVPEPGSAALMLLGAAGLAAGRRQRAKNAKHA